MNQPMTAWTKAKQILFIGGFLAVFLFPLVPAQAQFSDDLQDTIRDNTRAGAMDPNPEGTPQRDPRLLAAMIIKVFLGFMGTIMLILMLLSGYWYFTARGLEERITKAQDTARRAFIGLIIIMMAYGVTQFIFLNVEGAVNEGGQFYETDQPLDES